MRYISAFFPRCLGFVVTCLLVPAVFGQALQDPTKPNGFNAARVEATPQRSFTLASIIIGQDRRVAVIDGQARKEGQVFDGVRIRRIYPDRVELIDQGDLRVLRLSTLPQVRSSE